MATESKSAFQKGPKRNVVSESSAETQELASRLGVLVAGGDWIGLTGELGAGKTCFVQGLCKGLEVDPEVPVTSPTFTILQTYPGRVDLHHLDLYRLRSILELIEIGYDDLNNGQAVCVVEWCDQIPEARPADGLVISIELLSETSRKLEIEALGPRGAELLSSISSSKGE